MEDSVNDDVNNHDLNDQDIFRINEKDERNRASNS